MTDHAPPIRGFVQTDLATHEAWSQLTMEKPAAAALLHKLVVLADRDNTIVASHAALAEHMGVSAMTIRRALKVLIEGDWIDAAQIGGAGTVNAYVLNATVAWRKRRDGMQYATLRGTVLLSGSEQGGRLLSERARSLRPLPGMHADEAQLPSGDGLPPISQPSLPGMEPDLPARQISRAENSESDKFEPRQIAEFSAREIQGALNLTSEQFDKPDLDKSPKREIDEFTERKIHRADDGEIEE